MFIPELSYTSCALTWHAPVHAEPMVEPWPLTLSYRHTAALRSLSLASEERLSLIATPACFRSLGDARSFLQLLGSRRSQTRQPPAAPSASQLLRRGTAQWLAGRTCGASALYRCAMPAP